MLTLSPAIADTTTTDTTVTTSRRRSTRVKAILAGGLVLGLGAAVTLAAWTDQEFATGTFTAGKFNLVGSTDGTTFTDHASTDPGVPAALAFSANFNNLSPTSTVAAPYVLHLDATTTVAGTGTLVTANGTGAALTHLTYKVIQVASVAACTPAATGSATIAPSAAFAAGAVASTTPYTLAAGNGTTTPGADVFLCIQVTSDGTLVQGSTATATWQFSANSNS